MIHVKGLKDGKLGAVFSYTNHPQGLFEG